MKGNKHIPKQARTRSHGLTQGVYAVLYFALQASMLSLLQLFAIVYVVFVINSKWGKYMHSRNIGHCPGD